MTNFIIILFFLFCFISFYFILFCFVKSYSYNHCMSQTYSFMYMVQQLGEVARESIGKSAPPPMEDVLACVKNIRQVALLLQQPGRRFKGSAGPQAAAVCIQAHWR